MKKCDICIIVRGDKDGYDRMNWMTFWGQLILLL